MPSIKATLINSNPSEIDEDMWQEICLDFLDIIVETSPVDTGNFRDSWELNKLASDIYEAYNPAEYASFLEDGWSDQAPNGILGPAIEKLPNIIRSYLGYRPQGQVTISLEIPDYVP